MPKIQFDGFLNLKTGAKPAFYAWSARCLAEDSYRDCRGKIKNVYAGLLNASLGHTTWGSLHFSATRLQSEYLQHLAEAFEVAC